MRRDTAILLSVANIPAILIIICAFYMLTHGFGIGPFMLTIFIAMFFTHGISTNEK